MTNMPTVDNLNREAAGGSWPSAANEEGKEAGIGRVFGRCH